MSIRTIVELNHDFAAMVENAPIEFHLAVLAFLNSNSERNAEALKHFGVRVVCSRHHSEEAQVTLGGRTVEL